MQSNSNVPYLTALAVGVGSHVLYFNRYECHMHGFLYLYTFLVACAGVGLTLNRVHGFELSDAASATSFAALSFLTGLYGSTLIYRIFLNPLNRFPGPWATRIGNLYFSFQLGKSDAYYRLQDLHKKYGPIVRIGSNDLSIIDANTMETAYGPHSKVTKSQWYDGDAPLTSMHTSRDKALHDKRRKVWAPAFSDKALREYESIIDGLNDTLLKRFEEANGESVNVTKWFNLYSFDVMGRLAFGKDYGMLATGEKQEALELLSEGMQPLAFLLPVWLFRMLVAIPGLGAGFQKFVKFCVDELTWRIENAEQAEENGRTDIMSSILKAYKGVAKPQQDVLLQADARLIIVAGSDTTAATFTYLFYHLAADPAQVAKLREELKPLVQGEEWSDKDVRQAQHLNGAINEALRLHPSVPSGVSRMTPVEGMKVGDRWVPGRTNFIMPQYVMGRGKCTTLVVVIPCVPGCLLLCEVQMLTTRCLDPSIYTDPDSFVPERWYSKPEMIKNKDAFAPFSTGPFGCIGKNLALMELRTLTTRLVMGYDVKFAPGEDGHRLMKKTLDHFTVDLGDLDLVFTNKV